MSLLTAPPQSVALIADDTETLLPYTHGQFEALAAAHTDLRMERTAEGEIVIMPPAGDETSIQNAEIGADLVLWNRQTQSGQVFESSAGFTLPSGAVRSPDAAWVEGARWAAVPPDQRRRYAPLCPDFVLELRSDNDRLAPLQAKMREYLDNGARLGWLIDPQSRRVEIYRPGQEVEVLEDPSDVSGEDVLSGFVLDLTRIFP